MQSKKKVPNFYPITIHSFNKGLVSVTAHLRVGGSVHHRTSPVAITHGASSGAPSKTAFVTAEMAVSRQDPSPDLLRENTLLLCSSSHTKQIPRLINKTSLESLFVFNATLLSMLVCQQSINDHGHVPAQLHGAAGPVRRPLCRTEEKASPAEAGCKESSSSKEGLKAQDTDK